MLLPGEEWRLARQTRQVSIPIVSIPLQVTESFTHHRYPDSYHSCYTLAGLSSAQYHHYFEPSSSEATSPFEVASQWKCGEGLSGSPSLKKDQIFDEDDRVGVLHPLYVIPYNAVEHARAWCQRKGRF